MRTRQRGPSPQSGTAHVAAPSRSRTRVARPPALVGEIEHRDLDDAAAER